MSTRKSAIFPNNLTECKKITCQNKMTYFETFRKMVKMSKPFRTNFSLSKRLLLVTNAKFLLKMSEKNGLTKSNFSSFTFMSKTCILPSNFCKSTFLVKKFQFINLGSLLFFIFFRQLWFQCSFRIEKPKISFRRARIRSKK